MAALALAKRQDPKTIEVLSASLKNLKESWIVRTKVAESLGRIRGDGAEQALLDASSTDDHKVRRAVAEALGSLRSERVTEALIALTKDKSYLVTAAAARSLGNCADHRRLKVLTDLLKKDSWADVIRAGALTGLANSRDEDAVPTLLKWTEYGHPQRARRAALSALPRLGEGQKVREHLASLLQDRDPHIRSAVLSALATLGDPKAKDAISELEQSELDGGVRSRARQVLADLGKDGAAGLKEARHENQKLSREMTSLKTRLEKLEQQFSPKKSEKNPDKKSAVAQKSAPQKKSLRKTSQKPRR